MYPLAYIRIHFSLFCITWLLFPSFLFASNPKNKLSYRAPIEDWRFGLGYGTSLYFSDQMDYTITRNYGSFKEIRPTYFFGIFKNLNSSFEIGLNGQHGSMLTLKSENTQGSQCDFDEVQFITQYSLNDNIALSESRVTFNAQIGLGAIRFSAMYFTIDPTTQAIDNIVSTVGYGFYENRYFPGNTNAQKDLANKKMVVIGNLGLNLGVRVFDGLTVYWENSFNISTSNKLSGNLYKYSWIPPDCYVFSGIGLYINFSGNNQKKLSCPKF